MSFFVVIAATLVVCCLAAALAVDLRARERAERERTATGQRIAELEHALAMRTTALGQSERVRQQLWKLGHQIALQLDPANVLERYLDAVTDLAGADGGVVGLLRDDGKIHIVAADGIGNPLAGIELPVAGSAMGRVLRSGTVWSVADVELHRPQVHLPAHELLASRARGIAMLPLMRRGERIGAVALLSRAVRAFTEQELSYVAALSDALSLALENAELVETLRRAEWRFRTLFRAAPDAVLTLLQSGRIREANDAMHDVTGFDARLVVGRALVDLVVEPDRPKLQAALDAAFAGLPARLEVMMVAAPEAIAQVATASAPASASVGEPSRVRRRHVALAISKLPQAEPPTVLLLGRDMTSEREMRVRLMETDRLAAIGELVAGVAHEVNNPLSSISAFAQLLEREETLNPSQREAVEVIRTETTRASQVVKDLLAFARRSDPRREPLDFNSVVTRTLRIRAYQLTASNVETDIDLSSELPPVVGDARQLQQVCVNLVTNAIQAMAGTGRGTLGVSTRAHDGRVLFEVRDTGRGIPAGVREHIFEPFFTTKTEGEGTGLGLSVSYGIVAGHGGTIEVADTSPAGTVFRVTLPAAERLDTTVDVVADATHAALRSPLAGIKLLFVDDEHVLRSGMEAFGALRGFSVLTAANGRAALALVERTGVDAIVCDLLMPEMDGPSFVEALRQEQPGLAARTIFLTGDTMHTTGESATDAYPTLVGSGAPWARQPVVTKPFTFEKLEETLVAVLRASSTAITRH